MKEIPDIEKLDREYADVLWCLGLIGPEGDVVERFLAEIAKDIGTGRPWRSTRWRS